MIISDNRSDLFDMPFAKRAFRVFQRIQQRAAEMGMPADQRQNLVLEFVDQAVSPYAFVNQEKPKIVLPVWWLYQKGDLPPSEKGNWIVQHHQNQLFTLKEKELIRVYQSLLIDPKLAKQAQEFAECHELAHIVLNHKELRKGVDDQLSRAQELEADQKAVCTLGTPDGAIYLFEAMKNHTQDAEISTHPSYEQRITNIYNLYRA